MPLLPEPSLAGAESVVGQGRWPVAHGHAEYLGDAEESCRVGAWGPEAAPGLAVQIWSCLNWDCPGIPESGDGRKGCGVGAQGWRGGGRGSCGGAAWKN